MARAGTAAKAPAAISRIVRNAAKALRTGVIVGAAVTMMGLRKTRKAALDR